MARAPGRVNLIGDHTDYTGGLCLPIAIDRWVSVTGQRDPGSRVVELASDAEDEAISIDLDGDEPVAAGWGRYVAAVARRVEGAPGFRGTVRSDLPIGAGLSSSAALEVATALALGAGDRDPLALAVLCRDAEHEARGVPTGLLDQLASILGVDGHALILDCATNTAEPTPLPSPDGRRARRHLGDARASWPPRGTPSASRSAIGRRRRSARCARPRRPTSNGSAIRSLRRRARHVVTENARVRELAAAFAAGDLPAAGEIMVASHRSLRDDYESSTPGIDRLCDELQAVPGVFGARITGGGWGGAIVALARPGALADRGWAVRAVAGASVEIDAA